MVAASVRDDTPRMIRRLFALALWAYFSWYLAAMAATFLDGPAVAGPIAAALTALIGIAGWLRSTRRHATPLAVQPSR
jgi:membrane protein required for beta-lactamase induction